MGESGPSKLKRRKVEELEVVWACFRILQLRVFFSFLAIISEFAQASIIEGDNVKYEPLGVSVKMYISQCVIISW